MRAIILSVMPGLPRTILARPRAEPPSRSCARPLQVLAGWRVSPGGPWVADLLAAATQKLPRFSRSRLVELAQALDLLGVKMAVGRRLAELRTPGDIDAPACGGRVASGSWVEDGAAFLKAYLLCFQSRNHKRPLPRHLAGLAVALAGMCCEPGAPASSGPSWDPEFVDLLAQVLGERPGVEVLALNPKTPKRQALEEALGKLESAMYATSCTPT